MYIHSEVSSFHFAFFKSFFFRKLYAECLSLQFYSHLFGVFLLLFILFLFFMLMFIMILFSFWIKLFLTHKKIWAKLGFNDLIKTSSISPCLSCKEKKCKSLFQIWHTNVRTPCKSPSPHAWNIKYMIIIYMFLCSSYFFKMKHLTRSLYHTVLNIFWKPLFICKSTA